MNDSSKQVSAVDIFEPVEELAKLLLRKERKESQEKLYASTKRVLSLLGAGITIAGAIIAPKAASSLVKLAWHEEKEWQDWKKFNQGYLRQTLRRFERQKLVEIKEIGGKQRVAITSLGKTKVLEYAIEELKIEKQKHWDKKWRVVIYDIPNKKKRLQNLMRETLKNLGFLQIQESVYILPYPCYKEIEFLRTYYYLGEYIKYLLVDKLEDDSVYKTYFGVE